jgi:hypothetical protein
MLTLNELSNQCVKLQRLSDYLPILSLSHHLVEQIRDYKILCASIIGGYDGMKGIAHVTLRDDLMGKESFVFEPQILAVASSISNIYSIDLEINGFGYFENNTGKTIYMALELNRVSLLWFDNLRTAINAKNKSFIPHITITKQITHKAFDNLWPIFEYLNICNSELRSELKR